MIHLLKRLFSGPADPIQVSAARYARLIVRWREKNPGKPLHESLSGAGFEILLKMIPRRTGQRERLERLAHPEYVTEDIREFCRELVSVEADVTPDDPDGWAKVARAVDEELRKLGVAVCTEPG